VAAALIHRAIGEQLTCVFVDTGLLRLNEGRAGDGDIRQEPGRQGHPRRCHRAVHGQAGRRLRPGKKRKIIGGEFVAVFQAESAKLKNAKWLAQGTIYPDVIESAGAKTKKAHAIKSVTTTSAACPRTCT
jgi:GMP synthase (glutamine-hydrolysing)